MQDGRLRIEKEGRHRRFVRTIEQCTYNRRVGLARGQRALFITERAVLEADEHGLIVLEIAPGIDLDRDVLANFEICPRVSDRIGLMPEFGLSAGRFQASRSVRETSRPQNAPPAGFAA